jgi:hypothetical protein
MQSPVRNRTGVLAPTGSQRHRTANGVGGGHKPPIEIDPMRRTQTTGGRRRPKPEAISSRGPARIHRSGARSSPVFFEIGRLSNVATARALRDGGSSQALRLSSPPMASANAGVELSASGLRDAARSSVTIGVMVRLVVGKKVGITVFSLAAAKLGVAQFPAGMGTRQLVGLSTLAGIGFTVSLFIIGLAGFDDPSLVDQAKIGILAAFAVAAGGGLLILSRAADPARDSRHDLPSSLPE